MKTLFVSLHHPQNTKTQNTSIRESPIKYSPQHPVQIEQLTMKSCYKTIYENIDNYYCEGKLNSLEFGTVILLLIVQQNSETSRK